MQLHNLYIEDQFGDTLIYSEVTNVKLKKFSLEKSIIHIDEVKLENSFLRIWVDEKQRNSMHFFIDSLQKDDSSQEKMELVIDDLTFTNSKFHLLNDFTKPSTSGIDFSDLLIENLNISIKNVHSKNDTTSLDVVHANGKEKTGFVLDDLGFHLEASQQFIRFSKGEIITPYSEAKVPKIEFRYARPRLFVYLFDSIDMDISSRRSKLDFYDVAYFLPQVADLNGQFYLDGRISGKFKAFDGNLELSYLQNTNAKLDLNLSGLPNPDSSNINIRVTDFNFTPKEAYQLLVHYDIQKKIDTTLINLLGKTHLEGSFNSFGNTFSINSYVSTSIGSVNSEIDIKSVSDQMLYSGFLSCDQLNLGKVLNLEEQLSQLDMHLFFDGYKEDSIWDMDLDGIIEKIGAFEYDYNNIQIDGNLANKRFEGSLKVKDPNIDLSFDGALDFEKDSPSLEFTLDVPKLRPFYLNLIKEDPQYFASFLVKTDMEGIKLSEMNGELRLVNSFFKRTGDQLQIYDAVIHAQNSDSLNMLSLKSDQLDAEIRGLFSATELGSIFSHSYSQHMDMLPYTLDSIMEETAFKYAVNFKDIETLSSFFFPNYEIASGSRISGNFLSKLMNPVHELNGNAPYLRFHGLEWKDLVLAVKSDSSEFNIQLHGSKLQSSGELAIEDQTIHASLKDSNSSIIINWGNEETKAYSGHISAIGKSHMLNSEKRHYELSFNPSSIIYNNKQFDFSEASIKLNSGEFAFDSLLIQGEDQFVLADGAYNKNKSDTLLLKLHNLNVNTLNALSQKIALNLEGRMSGNSMFMHQNSKLLSVSDLRIDSLIINDQHIGQTNLQADWNDLENALFINIFSTKSTENKLRLSGTYMPLSGGIDFDIDLENANLNLLQPVADGFAHHISGYGDLDLTLDGVIEAPLLNGYIGLRGAHMILDQTKTELNINDSIRIYKNDIFLDDFTISDENEQVLSVNGNLSTTDFSSLFLNLDLKADNYHFLGTNQKDNEQFYGDIYASADARINGPFDQLAITIDARTEKYTDLKMPLYNAAEIQSTDFISFISLEEYKTPIIQESETSVKGVQLNMDLDITSGTSAQLIFDPNVGDIIEASGNGSMKIKMDENGALSVFGDVFIDDGEYLFTLQNVINKRFRVKPGGSITWNGSPTDAIINLDAIYETKASTYNLSPDPDESMKTRIPVQCLINLQGDLTNPVIKPSIALPTAEPETKALVDNSIGTEEDLMKQFISLLVIQNFMSSEGFGGTDAPFAPGLLAGGATATELFSNQLSNWLSQISNDFDVGFNYRMGDQVTSGEIGIALSTQLLNDKIILSGNLDYLGDEVDNIPGESSNIVGDFDLEFRVNDKVSLKAFNRVNDDRLIRPALYTQGLGVFYTNEFNAFSEIFNKKQNKPQKEKKRKNKKNDILKEEEEL